LQPAQLDALQEEHAEDRDRVLPSPERETPLKQEKILSTSRDLHSGQSMSFSEDTPRTSFSNSVSHFKHLYSKMGINPLFLTNDTMVGVGQKDAAGSLWSAACNGQ
jgi:hypothetical protein